MTNVTCLLPAEGHDGTQLFNDELAALPTREGRASSRCSPSCSRVAVPGFATARECAELVEAATALMPDDADKSEVFLDGAEPASHQDMRLQLLLIRCVERVRRLLAHEYGLPLRALRPAHAFVRRLTADAYPTAGLEPGRAWRRGMPAACWQPMALCR